MSEGITPSPDFDETRYERPNKNWICGHACEGCPCRIGPGPKGECRATTECKPALVTQTGETKGTWKCTRPKDWGGACETGPHPDGTCCKTIAKCVPARSLRNKRGVLTWAVVAACISGLLIVFTGRSRETFLNPAPLSPHHTGPNFVKMASGPHGDTSQGCVACHGEANRGVTQWVSSAVKVAQTSLKPDTLVSTHPKDFSQMDQSCLVCHTTKAFHQATVARETSCSACHLEHQGALPLAQVASQRCTDCHGDPAQMKASAEKSRSLPDGFFAIHHAAKTAGTTFETKRPAEGYTETITSFAKDHPEFRANRPGHTDTNTLAFNHALHLAGENMPKVNGKALDCASCHQPDASGAFMRRITFEQDCRVCHTLQFDERNPGMQLPHGDARFVRAYLHSLPAQYADHASRTLGIKEKSALETYVTEQMLHLREKNRSGEWLEAQVFFGDTKKSPAAGIAGLAGPGRARFSGCATCHEVTPQTNAAPIITPPVIPDRWMPHAQFNHAKHTQMACVECHTSTKSRLTSDINLPTQKSCIECHSPQRTVSDSCTSCHQYHNAPPLGKILTVATP